MITTYIGDGMNKQVNNKIEDYSIKSHKCWGMEIEWIKDILKLHKRCKFLQVYVYLIRAVVNMLLRGFMFNVGEFQLLSGVDLQR